tara:strand:+ start:174 stop:998 length:825 start_codon:yes stop_codon:yes gene_type:complete
MAKKKEKEEVAVAPEVMAIEPVVQAKPKKVEPKKPEWEFKDRVYFLSAQTKPLVYIVKSKNLVWFDPEVGYEREVQPTLNQKTAFVDEFKGQVRPEKIVFRDGMLNVPKEKVILQKILSLYHPQRGKLFYEFKPEAIAAAQVNNIELELAALNAANDLDIDMAEAVMRSLEGSTVMNMSTKELRRDLLVHAKNNPGLILDLIADDNIYLRNIGIKATEQGILKLSSDQRTFTLGVNGKKMMTVPFDEHPYSALAQWFKTDEGMEIYKGLEKRLR